MASRTRAVADRVRIEAIFRDDQIYIYGALIPDPPPEHGGRPLLYPHFMTIAWLALLAVFRSSRKLDAEMPYIWDDIRRYVQERFPDNPEMWLREEPMRRHHFLYGRERLTDPDTRRCVLDEFEVHAARIARELDLCDPDGPGSLTHPTLERTLYGDGKVLTPLYKAKPGDSKVDPVTGEIRQLRADPSAKLHITGSGEPAYGNKFVLIGVRSAEVHGRVILGIDHVPAVGGEAAVALDVLDRVVPRVPGTLAVLYDGALRGRHLQHLLHALGVIGVVPVQAASGGRRTRKPRTERTVRVGHVTVRHADGTTSTVQLYAEAGALCLGQLDENGDVVLVPLKRGQIRRRGNADQTWRWYGDYEIPTECGGGTILVRLDQTDDDRRRGFNRTEHLRPIPPSDDDYKALYPRRADSESQNRGLDDTHYLTRAHSVGHDRQLLDVLGFAIMVNTLARTRPAARLAARAA